MIRTSLCALVVLGLAGCKQTSAGPTDELFVGEYHLSAVNAEALPWTIPGFACDYRVTSATIALRSTRKVDGSMGYRYDCKTGGVSAPVQGQWTMQGDWHVQGGALLLIADAQPNRTIGPVMENGVRTDLMISLSTEIRDCTAAPCKTAQAVLTITH
jgi:hypothetical protein